MSRQIPRNMQTIKVTQENKKIQIDPGYALNCVPSQNSHVEDPAD